MKKKLIYGLAFIGMSTLLTGCHMKHGWTEETCTEPRTCSVGGETEGEALGHTWLEATCTEPKICSVCGETEGEALGHTWTEAANDASIACAICNFSAEELLNKPFGDEEITSIDMTLNSDMTLNMSDDDSGAAMEVNFTSDIDTQVCPTATHLVGSFSLNMLGRDVTQGIESYEIVNPDGSSLVYDKDYDTSTWIYFDSEADVVSDYVFALNASSFTSYEMVEPAKGATEYVINATAPYGVFNNMLEVSGVESFTEKAPFGEEIIKMQLVFDAETKMVKSIDFSLDNPITDDGVTLTKFDVFVTYNQYNNVDVVVPSNIQSAAISEDEFYSLDTDFDEDASETEPVVDENVSATGVENVDTDLYEEPINGIGKVDMPDEHVPDDFTVEAATIDGVTPAPGDQTMLSVMPKKGERYYVNEILYMFQDMYGEDINPFWAELVVSYLDFTPNSFIDEVKTYGITEERKTATAMLYDMGVLSETDALATGISSADLSSLVSALRNKDTDTINGNLNR